MAESDHHNDTIPSEIQEVIRVFVSSIRATKLYPENNPVHIQAIQRSFEFLDRHLQSHPEFVLGVLKTDFAFNHLPTGRDAHLYKSIAGDLFAKGIRVITLKRGITPAELRRFYALLAIPLEELRKKNSIKSLMWEQGLVHVAVTEAELDEVIIDESRARITGGEGRSGQSTLEDLRKHSADRAVDLFGRKVTLTDIASDPARFGALALDIAKKASDSQALRENRLFDLYRDVGRQILHASFNERRPLFDALAQSVMSMEPSYRDGLIARKLYNGLDAETVRGHKEDLFDHVPDDLHELLSARFSRSWTVPQVSSLLEKAASAKFEPVPAVPEGSHLPENLIVIAREMAEYTPEEMETLKTLGEHTQESAVVEAVVRTLIYVLPQVRNPFIAGSDEKHLNLFSGVVSHLEEMLQLLLEKKDYSLALLILRAFRMPAEPLFQPRLSDAVKRAGDRKIITRLLHEIRAYAKDSPEYEAIYSYLSLLDREVTPMLLEMLAEEQDRSLRNLMIRVLKELGKGQLALLGQRLSDERWYFVRNIITILGESRREEVVGYLERVAGHRNFQIRQEVVRALLSIKGERAAHLLARFLKDRDVDIRFMAVRGLGMSPGSGAREEQALIEFLKRGWPRKPGPELKVEAIVSLGKVGRETAAIFLRRFTAVNWWKPRKSQEAVKAAAEKAIVDIERRIGNAGRTR
jgi:hypothetical protein